MISNSQIGGEIAAYECLLQATLSVTAETTIEAAGIQEEDFNGGKAVAVLISANGSNIYFRHDGQPAGVGTGAMLLRDGEKIAWNVVAPGTNLGSTNLERFGGLSFVSADGNPVNVEVAFLGYVGN